MTLTAVETINCDIIEEQPDQASERIPLWRLPKLLWVGLALFSVNLVIGTGMLATPDSQTDVYGQEVQAASATPLKPSPFAEIVDTKKHKVQAPAKLYPVTFVPSPVEFLENLPVRTEPAVYTPGEQPAGRTPNRDNQLLLIN